MFKRIVLAFAFVRRSSSCRPSFAKRIVLSECEFLRYSDVGQDDPADAPSMLKRAVDYLSAIPAPMCCRPWRIQI